ncbi:hypothetical protein COU59_03080 [Candidatus Pacearchaeota archaeon CG10_big_fil_rev_8_21_14_0_10_34_12]|nr:MAG: hypothetical protein COU59_03080 [Candidatus Pacearchaeota archaeon CG10_big_fil_rev_8_21_14_0_10_34_12]
MTDFLFHNVSEKEKEEIRKQAKEIMDKFSEKIEKIGKNVPESFIERNEFEREERSGEEPDEDFRERVFANAPRKNKDFILGEKKGW